MKKDKNILPQLESYDDVVDNPASKVELICIKGYKGSYQVGSGQITFYSYKKGDVLPRTNIFLKPKNWELA